jgi:hypothetical protein
LADLFTPNAAFEVLMKMLIQKMKEPATRCVHLVREELKQVIEEVTSSCKEIGRFQELKEKVNQECMCLLRAKTKEAGEFVTNIVDMERYHIGENPGFDKLRSGVYTQQSVAAHHSNIEQSARNKEVVAVENTHAPQTASCPVEYQVRNGWKPHHIRVQDRELGIYVNETDEKEVKKVSLDGVSCELTKADDGRFRVLRVTCVDKGARFPWQPASETLQLLFVSDNEAAKWQQTLSNAGRQVAADAAQCDGVCLCVCVSVCLCVCVSVCLCLCVCVCQPQ